MADKEAQQNRPPRDVFCGWTADDQYITNGVIHGPGIARDVPAESADHLERAIRRVQEKREEAARIEPTDTGAVRPVSLQDATDEELLAIVSQRGLVQRPAAPEHTDSEEPLTAEELRALEENQKRLDAEAKAREAEELKAREAEELKAREAEDKKKAGTKLQLPGSDQP